MRDVVCFIVIILSFVIAIILSNYVSILFFIIMLIAAFCLGAEHHRSIRYKCDSCDAIVKEVCKTPYGIVCQECMNKWIEEQVENNWE
jgi:DNA-directed RNA polymerase subunit RPC12/RpoP